MQKRSESIQLPDISRELQLNHLKFQITTIRFRRECAFTCLSIHFTVIPFFSQIQTNSCPNALQKLAEMLHLYRSVMVNISFCLLFSNPSFDHTTHFNFASFSGPRKCIGFKFADLLIRTGLVILLQHFKFTKCERTQTRIQYSTTKNTLTPRDGVWVNVHRI